MAWPTATECKDYSADIPEVSRALTSTVEGKIEDAKILIKRYCKQEFDVKEEGGTKYFNGNDSNVLDLFPRCYAITSVVDESSDFTSLVNLKYGNNFSYLEAEYDVSDLGPRFRVRTDSFTKMFVLGSNNIQVTGNWGWAFIPDNIINVCKQLVERLIIKRLDIREWMTPFKSERTSDGYSYNKTDGLSSILDYELADKLNEFVYDLIGVYRI